MSMGQSTIFSAIPSVVSSGAEFAKQIYGAVRSSGPSAKKPPAQQNIDSFTKPASIVSPSTPAPPRKEESFLSKYSVIIGIVAVGALAYWYLKSKD